MSTVLSATGFPEEQVRYRARHGAAAAFPALEGYGTGLLGAVPAGQDPGDLLERGRIVPPVFMPERLKKLIELAREPLYTDVELDAVVGGFASRLPLYVSAFGSTQVASHDLGEAAGRQAGRLGIPMVIGENVVPVNGYRSAAEAEVSPLLGRIAAYTRAAASSGNEEYGGVVVQQSTEDADAEVWNLVYSDPVCEPLLATGRLAFELKVGQGAKPGLGGLTVLGREAAGRVAEQYATDEVFGTGGDRVLRISSPGTFTEEILRQQIRLMRNNFPRAKVWVKLHPGRDVALAAATAWAAGADSVTVDGAEAGTAWAPSGFLGQVGLPLGECLTRIGRTGNCLLASGRMWEGTRAVKALALGAHAVGLGRAALLAVDEDAEDGLVRLVESIALELRLLISAVGKYRVDALDAKDVLLPPA
ncbi:alpha-hydroxy-acid oxidizing protein [Streptomyces sp. 5-8]|uniref:Alpha-hydroxy-acid oxidizing protein n=1 Tax=Streptomyces musisoli TaxID=2802280 RepID=A0ABS1PBY6_9ACTN|nr:MULTISPECIES: glutamate synthase-related protein [Streptomyces]MBL1109799.1 alpha-hydroxy-acid oxidizing protein [Streptomyces musisoli]MBY8845914.1 alpha-hydroxy-acid oxidizing protein [Streptomyces sp. SP2-10]